MRVVPCTCEQTTRSSRWERDPSAIVADGTDADGRWHGYLIGKTFHPVALVTPSQEYEKREAPRRAEVQAEMARAEHQQQTMAILRAKRGRGEQLTASDREALFDSLLGV